MASILLTTAFNISNVYAANYTVSELKKLARKAAKRYNVNVGLIFAIIQQESGWKIRAVSNKEAIGVMQIIPSTGKSACALTKTELYDAEKNINCGVKYFHKQLRTFDGNVKLALCAYNAGPGRAKKGIKRCNRIKETRNYIRRIMNIWGAGKEYLEIPDNFVDSAKTIADNHFIYGKNYHKPSQWWRLVCEAVDEVYYKKLGERKQAITKFQQKLWRRILSATVSDIYADIQRLGQQNKWSKKKLRSKIKKACPNGEQNDNSPVYSNPSLNQDESAIDIADNWFKKRYSTDNWWQLLCKAIDEVYYRKTNTRKARTKSQKKIWSNILDTTVNEFYTNEVRKGNNNWPKKRIKRKITSSCP